MEPGLVPLQSTMRSGATDRSFHCILSSNPLETAPFLLEAIVASTAFCGCLHWKLSSLPLESAARSSPNGPRFKPRQKESCRTYRFLGTS
ncbi:MAG TPA: hypothetical protein VGS22_01350, partial [Thermoanaerobaculia bacterium]|nr:hypothetical protein [Thermoanaerobaculia bacterium]